MGPVPNKRAVTGALDKPQPKKVHIKTFGCQMNAYDSERMAEALEAQGYAQTEDGEDADLVILNTCHIREKAAEKVYSELGRVRLAKERRKRDGRDTIVAVAGCVAQAEGAGNHRPRARRRYRGRPAKLSPPGRADRSGRGQRQGRGGHGFPRRGEVRASPRAAAAKLSRRPSSPCRKAATSSAPSASCPIRAAPNSRGRSRRSSPR